MSWIGRALNVVGKIGGIASKFAGAGGTIGKIAGGISKAANLISTVAPKAAPWITGAAAVGKILYKTGIADKLTGGKASKIVKGIQNFISPFKAAQSSYGSAVQQATGGGSYTSQAASMIKR